MEVYAKGGGGGGRGGGGGGGGNLLNDFKFDTFIF